MSTTVGLANAEPKEPGQFRLAALSTDHINNRVNAVFTDNAGGSVQVAIQSKSAKATPADSIKAAFDACLAALEPAK